MDRNYQAVETTMGTDRKIVWEYAETAIQNYYPRLQARLMSQYLTERQIRLSYDCFGRSKLSARCSRHKESHSEFISGNEASLPNISLVGAYRQSESWIQKLGD